jgi:hypothetical protein
MLEHVCDLARGHRSTLEIHRQEDAPSDRVGERGEYRFVRVHPRLRFVSFSTCPHPAYI